MKSFYKNKLLIAYYSWANGNTKKIAEQLQKEVGGDLVRIETVISYSDDYDKVVEQGKKEADSGFQPLIQPLEVDLSEYDVIAVGTPTWWYTMAPAIRSFLNQNDFEGKTLIPFMTNAGWPGHVLKDMQNACAGTNTVCAKEFLFDRNGGDKMETSLAELKEWLDEVKKVLQ